MDQVVAYIKNTLGSEKYSALRTEIFDRLIGKEAERNGFGQLYLLAENAALPKL